MKGLKRILSQLIICYSHEMILGGTEINLHKVRVVLQVNFRDDPKVLKHVISVYQDVDLPSYFK